MHESHKIGDSPWDRSDMISHLEEFLSVYENKPIADNHGGQKASHLFYSWYVAKKMKPDIIIESGVYKGQGTWAFENASPNSRMICLDPYLKNYEGYRSKKAEYFEVDFKQIDWSRITDKSKVLCFFDDHQNAFERIVQMKIYGFKVAMFEDNYPEGHGDCISLKKIFEFPEKYQVLPEYSASEYITKVTKVYQEFPPIFSIDKTRWGTGWMSYRSNPPIFKESNKKFKIFEDEMDEYTWINYLELN